MNGNGGILASEETIFGVPVSTWEGWSESHRIDYLEQYGAVDPFGPEGHCFTHGDGRTTCYTQETTTGEILAYTYTYGVEEVTGDDVITHDTGVEVGEDVNEVIDTVIEVIEDLPEDLQDIYEEGKEYATLAILVGAAVLLSK